MDLYALLERYQTLLPWNLARTKCFVTMILSLLSNEVKFLFILWSVIYYEKKFSYVINCFRKLILFLACSGDAASAR